MQNLTERQRAVLDFIVESIHDRGYPPTLREIGMKLGIRSTNGVNDHLRALERKGFLTREDMKSRTLRPVRSSGEAGVAAEAVADSEAYVDSRVEADFEAEQDYDPEQTYVHRHRAGGAGLRGAGLREAGPREASDDDDIVEVSVFGRVAAGLPAQALEQRIDTVRIDRMMLGGRGHVFGLRITGDSMIEAGIFDGDYVFVRKQIEAPEGAIVVCLVGDEATCKRFYPEKHHIRLEPANAQMASILIPKTDWRETRILGVVVGVYRKL